MTRSLNADRAKSVAGVVAIHALLGYALIVGLRFEAGAGAADALAVFDLPATVSPPPVEEPEPAAIPSPDPKGAAAPPNLRAEPTPVVAPPPPVRLPVPTPVAAAPIAGQGSETSAGAAEVAGPGTGAGGEGTGTGSGNDGSGSGGGGGVVTRARLIAGRIRNADYPRGAGDAGAEGTVVVHFDVGVDGVVSRCRVVDSSGNAELDATTCRVIERRFRYEPARDASGRAVPDVTGWKEIWWIGARPPGVLGEVEVEN